MKIQKRENELPVLIGACLFLIGLIGTSFAAWCTHVIVCVQSHEWFLLIAGAIAFPVAIVHGIGVWFGAWG